MMDPSNAFNKFGPTKKPPLVRKLSVKDKRVNELLGSEPYVTCPTRLNAENMGTPEDGSTVELTGVASASSSPLQDLARFALRAMEEQSRLDGSEVTPGFGFRRKISTLRAHEGGSPFQSWHDSSFMGPEDLANGAGFSSSFCAPDAREMDATNQSPASERHVGKPIPGKRKRGRPAKTDPPRLNQSQTRPSKKQRLGGDIPDSSAFANSPVQAGVIEAGEGSGRATQVKGRKKRASVLKPISENAPKRRGRPPKKHLTAPSSQPILGDALPNPDGRAFQNSLDNVTVPESQESLDSSISKSGHERLQESKGFTLSFAVETGDHVSNPTQEKSIIAVKKRGPGRPRKTERILSSIEDHPEHLARFESGAQSALGRATRKSEPRKTKSLEPSLKSKATSGTPQAEAPANRGREQQQKSHSLDELSAQQPYPTESVSEKLPGRPRKTSTSASFQAAAPQATQQTWCSNITEEASSRPSKDMDLSVLQLQSQPQLQFPSQSPERSGAPDATTTMTVKKRRGRPPKNKSALAAL